MYFLLCRLRQSQSWPFWRFWDWIGSGTFYEHCTAHSCCSELTNGRERYFVFLMRHIGALVSPCTSIGQSAKDPVCGSFTHLELGIERVSLLSLLACVVDARTHPFVRICLRMYMPTAMKGYADRRCTLFCWHMSKCLGDNLPSLTHFIPSLCLMCRVTLSIIMTF